jgi:hypothetical protein
MGDHALVELPVSVPLFFAEACGYRGRRRFVALRWHESAKQLWFTDDGHAVRGVARPMTMLWRRSGGRASLERYRAELQERGAPPWFVVDRAAGRLGLGSAAAVGRLIESQSSVARK